VAECVAGCDELGGRCILAPNGTVCRKAAGDCDAAETCDGAKPVCPPEDLKVPKNTVCREAAGDCDVAEKCDGVADSCPADSFVAPALMKLCRLSAGTCDVPETCDGSGPHCPADGFRPDTYVCRTKAGTCDVEEKCTGATPQCPPDGFASSTVECRPSAGDCDLPEFCDGKSAGCPGDSLRDNTFVCRAKAGACDTEEKCTGSSAQCPGDSLVGANIECRPATDICDVPESCDGATAPCPDDSFRLDTFVCRAKAGTCDVEEKCTGSSAQCPGDSLVGTDIECRPAAGDCDVPETCDGPSADCPGDSFRQNSFVCRAKAGDCDVEEKCSGSSADCPQNGFAQGGDPCSDGSVCTNPDGCDGNGTCSPGPLIAPGAPVPLSPENGALTGSIWAPASFNTRRPLFRWRPPMDDGCGAATYDVQVDDSCLTSSFRTCLFPSPEASATGLSAAEWRPGADLATNPLPPLGARYYWRIRACRGAACSPWSAVRYVDVGRAQRDFNGDGYDDVAVGAIGQDNPEADEGAVFVYYGSASGVDALAPAVIDNPTDQENAAFGTCVAAAGDINGDGYADLVVGAHLYDNGTQNEGSAFVYYGSAVGLPALPALTLDNPVAGQTDAAMGECAAAAGDLNGDGFADFVVGASKQDNGASDEGNAFVYYGSAGGPPSSPSVTLDNPLNQGAGYFGWRAAGAGDLNGDGYADLVVGAYAQDNPTTNEGSAYVYYGSSSGVPPAPAVSLDNPTGESGAFFGRAVASCGDLNGDGYADLVVGAPYQDNGAADEGNAFIYYGSNTGIPVNPSVTLDSVANEGTGFFGRSVAAAGDVDGDGYADLVVGAPYVNGVNGDEGKAYLYQGSGAGIGGAAPVKLDNPAAQGSGYFGWSVSSAGDVNGDGLSDIVIGAPYQNDGATDEGNAFIYHGSTNGIPTTPSVTLDNPANQAGGRFGYHVD
jgi:hypothetical protein